MDLASSKLTKDNMRSTQPQKRNDKIIACPTIPHRQSSEHLGHRAKNWIVTTYARTLLHVFGLAVGNLIKFGSGSKHAATEPNRVALHTMRNNLHVDWFGRDATSRQFLAQS